MWCTHSASKIYGSHRLTNGAVAGGSPKRQRRLPYSKQNVFLHIASENAPHGISVGSGRVEFSRELINVANELCRTERVML